MELCHIWNFFKHFFIFILNDNQCDDTFQYIFTDNHHNSFFYRIVMVVRKNVLECIIALVIVKNKDKKVLKKISNMTKFHCPNKSIYYC
jgi:hypothetical protein